MFEAYKKAVLAAYDMKKHTNQLSDELVRATPGKLRDEWVKTCKERLNPEGERLLRSFFDQKEDLAEYIRAMEKYGADKCRPLSGYLDTRRRNPDQKHIELLAWLIDFQPRPYIVWLKRPETSPAPAPLVDSEPSPLNSKESVTPVEANPAPAPIAGHDPLRLDITEVINHVEEPLTGAQNESYELQRIVPVPGFSKKYRMLGGVFLMAFVVAIVCYLFTQRQAASAVQKCMYWSGDRYEPIACDQKPADTSLVVLALDSVKMQRFKKITRPDTLTAAAVGHVWYAKDSNGAEFFTAPGVHPLDPDRRLLPITLYILDKYNRSK